VTCVSGEAWATARSVRIPGHTDLPASVHLDGVTVGCAPVCGRLDVDIAPTTCKDRPAYAVQRGTLLTFFESVGGRLCTLVCEDLGRPAQDGSQLLDVGPSIIMAPVLSKPTLMYHWEHSDAQKLAASIGASTIVANSLIVTDAMKEAGLGKEGQLGTALAQGGVNGQAVSDAVDDPADLVLFRVTPEETVVVRRIDHDS
jgi:hypothetical protein